MSGRQRVVKRSFDILCSAAGLLLLWPLIVLGMLAVRLETGQSGLFRQRRIGRFGAPFTVYKLRTMHQKPNQDSSTITVDGDPRITRVGRFLRRTKLDELPQLWNVLWGSMSLVGPRPDVEGYADSLQGEERRMLLLRPGITGPATLRYRDEERLLAHASCPRTFNDKVIFPDKVKLNIHYLDNWSLVDDVRYILMTIGLIQVPVDLAQPVEDMQ